MQITVIDRGSGAPVVVIPGIQGRWEFMAPAIDALARRHRVLTFPLSGEPDAACRFDAADGIDNYTRQTLEVLDQAQLPGAVICGVSFGGLAAIRFAAQHPQRTRALVLVSTPGPGWRIKPRHQLYAKAPWLFGALFLAELPWRLRPELAAALPERGPRARFAWQQIATIIGSGVSTRRMGQRALMMNSVGLTAAVKARSAVPRSSTDSGCPELAGAQARDLAADCARITAPALIVTGEPHLDRVVPVASTLEYATLISGAQAAVIPRSGHVGLVTRPEVFADLIERFMSASVASVSAA